MSTLEKIIDAAIDVTSHCLKAAADRFHSEPSSFFSKEISKTENFLELQTSLARHEIRIDDRTDQGRILENIQNHLEYVSQWCSEVYMKDMVRKRKLSDVYVGLDTYLIPRRRHVSEVEVSSLESSSEILSDLTSNVLIQGLPGAGKTTTIKNFLHKFSAENDEQFSEFSFPLFVRLRDVNFSGNTSRYLFSHLSSMLNYDPVYFVPQELKDSNIDIDSIVFEMIEDAFYQFVSELRPLVVLDGFDEIPSHEAKRAVFDELSYIQKRFPKIRIIMTCRTGEMPDSLYEYRQYEIAPLSKEQIEEFSKNWIQDLDERERFVEAILSSPFFDSMMRPLALTQLCAIYERTGGIPDRPKSVYRRVVRLMLEEWDEQRRVKRESSYSNFDIDEKYEFLCSLAYYFSVTKSKYQMTTDELKQAYDGLAMQFALPRKERSVVVKELESHTGLFVQSGAETYEFSHKSLQEYLAAEHIIKLPSMPGEKTTIGNISSELALAVSLSSKPSSYLYHLVVNVFQKQKLDSGFYYAFLNRLAQEMPQFEDREKTFYTVVVLLSLWFCDGVIPHRETIRKMRKADFVVDLKIDNWPRVEDLFSGEDWEVLLESMSKQVDIKRIEKEKESVFLIVNRALPHQHVPGRINHLLLPQKFLSKYKFKDNGLYSK